MDEMDLKKILNSMGEVEPPPRLEYRILEAIRSHKKGGEFWFLKPAAAFASILILTVLGAKAMVQFLPRSIVAKDHSAVLQWAKHTDAPFPKLTLTKGETIHVSMEKSI